MAVSKELEQKMFEVVNLNTKILNIYSELRACKRKFIDEVFAFNEKKSACARYNAVRIAKECSDNTQKLEKEFNKARAELVLANDILSQMLLEEQEDFLTKVYNYEKGV